MSRTTQRGERPSGKSFAANRHRSPTRKRGKWIPRFRVGLQCPNSQVKFPDNLGSGHDRTLQKIRIMNIAAGHDRGELAGHDARCGPSSSAARIGSRSSSGIGIRRAAMSCSTIFRWGCRATARSMPGTGRSTSGVTCWRNSATAPWASHAGGVWRVAPGRGDSCAGPP